MFSYCFDILVSKKIKKNIDAFISEKHFEKQSLSHFQIPPSFKIILFLSKKIILSHLIQKIHQNNTFLFFKNYS
jgi:hypothetical protein